MPHERLKQCINKLNLSESDQLRSCSEHRLQIAHYFVCVFFMFCEACRKTLGVWLLFAFAFSFSVLFQMTNFHQRTKVYFCIITGRAF